MQPHVPPKLSSSTCSTHDEHHRRHMREQQRLMEELMHNGLVQPADLIALGFTEEEVNAAGYAVTVPLPNEEADVPALVGHPERRAKARKRGSSEDRATPTDTLVAHKTPEAHVMGEPRTAAKVIDADAAPEALSVSHPATLSEQSRRRTVTAAQLVDQRRSYASAADCSRALRFDVEGDEAAAACAGATQTSSSVNTALRFSGLDVAVSKEIAFLLSNSAEGEGTVAQRCTQEYLESRRDGNTPYM